MMLGTSEAAWFSLEKHLARAPLANSSSHSDRCQVSSTLPPRSRLGGKTLSSPVSPSTIVSRASAAVAPDERAPAAGLPFDPLPGVLGASQGLAVASTRPP
jgi:hypothetical protein